MMFDELQDGEKIFIDANIFVYHFGELSGACKHLLSRCSKGQLRGYTSTAILAEVLHRLMIVEAVKKGHVKAKNPVQQLKKNPEIVKQLSEMCSRKFLYKEN
jgi:predicted nucleic acid-binding protein